MLARTALILALLASLAVAPAGAAPGEPGPPARALSTPDLLDRAVKRGRLHRSTADLFLAFALGDHGRLPDRFVSDVPWDGTLPLLRLREQLERMPPAPARAELAAALDPVACDSPPPEPDVNSTYFHIHHDDIGGGLDINDYMASLDKAWEKQVNEFGWAAPPLPPGSLYPVVVEDLGPGLYGFVMATTQTDDNLATPWNELDAFASCMALNQDYTGFPSSPQDSLDATTAHELNHSIQFGYGAITGPNAADDVFVEGGATWMEDEVFDDSDDNHGYLWPEFDDSMGAYEDHLPFDDQYPYPYWVVFRALTERFGTGAAGMGEEVMQDFWEAVSQSPTSTDLTALGQGLAGKGTTLADAYHSAAVALRFNQPCAGGWTAPYCLEEGPLYVSAQGAPPLHGAIAAAGASFSGTIEDNYALNWVALPQVGPYPVALRNASGGGALRATVACATPAGPKLATLPAVAGPGEDRVLLSFDPTGCLGAPVAVITNESQTAPNPAVSTPREYVVSASLAPKDVKLKARPRKVDRGERTRLKATVSPCAGHEGDTVGFFRGKKKIATKQTNGSCVATKKVRVSKTSVFRAVSSQQDEDHSQGTSRKVRVRVRRA
jgi:hypothetical protein